MDKIIETVAKGASTSSALLPLRTTPHFQAYVRAFDEERRPWSGPFRKVPGADSKPGRKDTCSGPIDHDSVWMHLVRRCCLAWISVNHALTVDSGRSEPYLDATGLNVLRVFLELEMRGRFTEWIKESTAFIFAVAAQQTELSPGLSKLLAELNNSGLYSVVFREGIIGPGWVAAYCRWLMAPRSLGHGEFGRRVLCAAQNVLYIKKTMPPAEPWDVVRSLIKHRDALTQPHIPETECERFVQADIRDNVKVALHHLVRHIFRKVEFQPKLEYPSANASFGSTRGKWGGFGWLQRESHLLDLEETEATEQRFCSPLPSVLSGMYEVRPGVVKTVRRSENSQYWLDRMRDTVMKAVEYESMDAYPVPILEPCKIRMITKGPEANYMLALSLQKLMHRTMRQTRWFQWIGKPIDDEAWNESYDPSEMRTMLEYGYKFVSGDYSAATDNLNPELSEAAWMEIANTVVVTTESGKKTLRETDWFDLGKRCLTGHQLYSDDAIASKKGDKASHHPPLKQRWGQLMGSPMSFPILNLVNAAATAVGLGWEPTNDVSVMEFLDFHRVRTNGDDIAFLIKEDGYQRWKDVVTASGLTPSLGKNYLSDSFLIINSEMRQLMGPAEPFIGPLAEGATDTRAEHVDKCTRRWVFNNFLNLPILFGMTAKGTDAGEFVYNTTPFFQLGPLNRALVRGCDWLVSERRSVLFRQYYWPVLTRVPAGCGFSIPEGLGGLGLPWIRGDDPPEVVLRRCAYLSCLDTKTRLEATSAPTVENAHPFAKQLKKSLTSEAVTTKTLVAISQEKRDLDVLRNMQIRMAVAGDSLKGSMVGSALGDFAKSTYYPEEVMRQLFPDLDEAERLRAFMSSTGSGLETMMLSYEAFEDSRMNGSFSSRLREASQTKDQARRAAEQRFWTVFSRVSRRAHKASALSPMNVGTILDWSDPLALVEATIYPHYDVGIVTKASGPAAPLPASALAHDEATKNWSSLDLSNVLSTHKVETETLELDYTCLTKAACGRKVIGKRLAVVDVASLRA